MIDTKPFLKSLHYKPVAVLGLGLSGLSTALAFLKSGATLYAWDDDEEKRRTAQNKSVPLKNLEEDDFEDAGALILSPGIPLTFPKPHPVVTKAYQYAVPIIGDLEVFHICQPERKTIGITGTNGKSTTTALITHILKSNRLDAMAAGNIGKPVLECAFKSKESIAVLEMSSYQLELCPSFHPSISVLLNITPDHIDRHGSMESYIAAKEKILVGQGEAVCGVDDNPTQKIFEKLQKQSVRKAYPVSIKKTLDHGVCVEDGFLKDAMGEEKSVIGSITSIATLPGIHNQQNICAAYAVARLCGLTPDRIIEAIKTYPGLPHRQEVIRIINGVAYINDSKATNFDAASRALGCYSNIYLIAGGLAKEGGLTGIETYAERIRHVFLIGESAEEFFAFLKKTNIPATVSGTMDIAVLEAHRLAQSERGQPGGGGSVLLSPACASWDQFKNFEHRGEVFRALVESLSEETAP